MRSHKPNKNHLERLRSARLKMARIVKAHGEKFWPIFERIDNEYKEEIAKSRLLDDIIAGDEGLAYRSQSELTQNLESVL